MMLDKNCNGRFSSVSRLGLIVAITLFLGGCTSHIIVEANVPTPLVERLPITAEIIYTDEFKDYTYTEAEKGRSLKSLGFGVAQINMFDKILGSLLNLVGPEETAELTIEPQILDFQYTAPRETNLNLYEVWLRYRLKLSGKNDEKLADWTIKAYGKTPKASFSSAATAFNAATNVALRDVGAQLSIRLPNQSAIKGLLDTPNNPTEQADEVQSSADAANQSAAAELTEPHKGKGQESPSKAEEEE